VQEDKAAHILNCVQVSNSWRFLVSLEHVDEVEGTVESLVEGGAYISDSFQINHL
jgi:hypothetical protein